MDQSITPSLLDLYKKSANPQKTNVERIHVQDTPFVRSTNSSSVKSERPPSIASSKSSKSSRRSSRRSSGRPSQKEENHPNTPAFFTQGQQIFAQRNKEKEKTALLNEYNRLRIGGSATGRMLSEQDDIADIRWEINRVKNHDDCVSTVAVMKDAIKLGATFVDMGNKRLGLLKLNGPGGNWSDECTRDMQRFDRCLTKLYQRYIRKGAVSPFIELALLIFGPMLAVHFKNSMLPAPTQPSRSRNVPFQQPKTKTSFEAKPTNFMQQQRAPMPGPNFMQQQRAPMPGPNFMQQQRAPMPGPNVVTQQRASMPGPNFMQQQRAPMPGPNVVTQQQRAPMPGPNMVQQMPRQIEITIQKPARRQEESSLQIVEEGEESDEFSSDHHSIDINEDMDENIEDDMDSSSVGSLTF